MLQGNYTFEYAGISSGDFGDGLVIWYLSDVGGQYEEPLYNVEIIETRLPIRHDPLFHTVTDNVATTRDISFGFEKYVDRETVDEVMRWLTNQRGYQKLVITDDDELCDYSYYCIFQNVQMVSNGKPYGFTAQLVMKDQFAHEEPTTSSYQIRDNQIITSTGLIKDEIRINNDSALYDYMYPKIVLKVPISCDEFYIINLNDKEGNRPFIFRNLSSLATTDGSETLIIEVDNLNRIITSPNIGNTKELYKCFGNTDEHYHYFFRLLCGENILKFVGTGVVEITIEMLRKVGM